MIVNNLHMKTITDFRAKIWENLYEKFLDRWVLYDYCKDNIVVRQCCQTMIVVR